MWKNGELQAKLSSEKGKVTISLIHTRQQSFQIGVMQRNGIVKAQVELQAMLNGQTVHLEL